MLFSSLQMMWALEYDPELFFLYEEADSTDEKSEAAAKRAKSIRQYGKFERENMKNGKDAHTPLPISVFLVASVLKDKSSKLQQEARGLDDVVKVSLIIGCLFYNLHNLPVRTGELINLSPETNVLLTLT